NEDAAWVGMESAGVCLDPVGCMICIRNRSHHCPGVLVFRVSRRVVWNQTIVDRGTHISSGRELAAETRHLALVAEQEAASMECDHYRPLPARCRVRLIHVQK